VFKTTGRQQLIHMNRETAAAAAAESSGLSGSPSTLHIAENRTPSSAHLFPAAYAEQLALLQQPQAVRLVTLPAQLMACRNEETQKGMIVSGLC
jgi:hypothetical protein